MVHCHPTPAGPRSLGAVFLVAACTLTFSIASAAAEGWPTYRHDIARSGVTSESVGPPLSESWVFRAAHAPRPAWDDPPAKPLGGKGFRELRRMHFDDVFQVVAADGAVYFGSSVDNKVYALDAATGAVRWTCFTGGPVRLAPTIAEARVFVGSDDGHAYCLDARDGSVVWRYREQAPENRRVLGHGKMISLWPSRTGVLVDDGVAYFGAGIFPGEGVFLHAVDATDGRKIWLSDGCGEPPQSRVSPQGYLLASKTRLFAPMGRVSPAAFDRQNGRLLHETFFGHHVGGAYALLAGDEIYTGTEEIAAYNSETRTVVANFAGQQMVVSGQTAYLAGPRQLVALDRKTRSPRWKTDCSSNQALILAGQTLFAGGEEKIVAVDAESGRVLWTGAVEGTAKGLAVAEGRLLVSTDRGRIHSFAPSGAPQHGPVEVAVDDDPYADSPLGPMFERAAETILSETQVRRGYALVLGCSTGQLALELARRSELMIYVVEPDAAKVATAREALDAAGVYGARVCVDRWPLDAVPYADYFANLVVSESAMVTGQLPPSSTEMLRMLKPLGGTAVLGQPHDRPAGVEPLDRAAIRRWLPSSDLEEKQTPPGGNWANITRGPLPGAGSWTHQYANPGNTACGDDRLVKCPLGVLWFGHPGPKDVPERHLRAAAPLSIDGRLFVQGENVIAAYDAYNGLELWRRAIPGAVRVNVSHNTGNLALDSKGLFVAAGDRCLRLDPATGETKSTYRLPQDEDGKPHTWGYVATVDGLLYGSRVADASSYPMASPDRGPTFADRKWDDALSQADLLFALDIETGSPRWVHREEPFPQNSISIGDGSVFFVSPDLDDAQRQEAVDRRRRAIEGLPEAERVAVEKQMGVHLGRVVALDASTGRIRWQKPIDLTGCGGEGHGKICWTRQGAKLATMYHDGALVIFGVYLDGHHWSSFFAGRFAGRWMTAVAGDDGETLWSRPVGFRVRPLIIGETLYAEPWKLDLKSGERRVKPHPVTGQPSLWQFARPGHHCGCPSAAPTCLFFRSFTLGYYDLLGDFGTVDFGGQRPGCWINAIPAAGLVMVPEASAGCTCSFPNACTVVFQPTSTNKAWGMVSAPGPITPVRRLALNLGMSGDRNDAAGRLWLGYPRPYGNPPPGYPKPGGAVVLRFDLETDFYPGGRFDRQNSTYTDVAGADDPWLFTSAACGLRQLVIPLLAEGDEPASYRVRMAFTAPVGDKPGSRVFDVKLQGKLVEEDFDVVGAAGAGNRAVFKEFSQVEVRDHLTVELVAKVSEPSEHQWPLLQALEIIRNDNPSAGSQPDGADRR